MRERKKAQERLAQAQADLAALKKQDRKIDAHFKIMLGAWFIAACWHDRRSVADLVNKLGQDFKHSPHPSLISWLEKLDKDENERLNRIARKAAKG